MFYATNPYPPEEGLHRATIEPEKHKYNKEGKCWCSPVLEEGLFIHNDSPSLCSKEQS